MFSAPQSSWLVLHLHRFPSTAAVRLVLGLFICFALDSFDSVFMLKIVIGFVQIPFRIPHAWFQTKVFLASNLGSLKQLHKPAELLATVRMARVSDWMPRYIVRLIGISWSSKADQMDPSLFVGTSELRNAISLAPLLILCSCLRLCWCCGV